MNRIAIAVALFAGSALTACGRYEPVVNPSVVELAVGETQTLVVTAHCTPGYSYVRCDLPNFSWQFSSANPAIAAADVVVESSSPRRSM